MAPVAPTQEPFLRVRKHTYSNVLATLSSVGPPQNLPPYPSYICTSEINHDYLEPGNIRLTYEGGGGGGNGLVTGECGKFLSAWYSATSVPHL